MINVQVQYIPGGLNMRKHLTVLLTICLAALVVVACSSQGNKTSESPKASDQASNITPSASSTPDAPVTLKFASWSINEAATKDALQQMADTYTSLHKNVKIEFIGIPFANIKDQTFVMASSGDAPDIIQTFTATFPTYAASDYVEPLDELLGKDYVNDLLPSYKDDYSYNGKLMGIPWAASPYVLYWNKELFKKAGLEQKPPTTYDEMLDIARKISKLKTDSGESIYGLGEPTDKLPINGMIFLKTLYSFGGSIFDANGKVNVNTPEAISAFKYYQTLANENLSPQAAKLKDLRNLFSIGRLGMYADGYYGKAVFRSLSGKGEAFDNTWESALVPAGKSGKSVSIGEAHGLVITKDSKYKKEAADFIKFLTDKDMMLLYHQKSDVVSARKSIIALPEFNTSPLDKVLNEQMGLVQGLPKNNRGLEQSYLDMADSVLRVSIGKETPEKIAADLDAKLKQSMK
jgi:multiple sugar transport system substrate-binding protein